MASEPLLFVPVILGTGREGRRSEHAARFVYEEVQRREGIETALLDVRDFRLPATDDSEKTALEKKLAEITTRADGFIIVSPEYNHGYPGELKMMLDMSDGEYARKPIAICGVSGGGMGGVRMVEQLRSVCIELGAVPISEAVYFSKIGDLFDESGTIKNDAYEKRIGAMLDELQWYATALKRAREENKLPG